MKLQNFTVLFVIIILPIIIVTSYYMSLQIDTINMQTSYDTKLLDSTKEAIESFEINTVEWNSSYSATAESKRRDIMASINTFTTSFANNLGIGGSSTETMLAYIPAIAYTLYDGYYIYSPAETKVTIKDSNEMTVFMNEELIKSVYGYGEKLKDGDDGKILYEFDDETYTTVSPSGTYNGTKFTLNPVYAKTEYKHILKPFSAYSKQYTKGNVNVVVNYTLDNYIRVYGTTQDGAEYVYKSGYLINTGRVDIPNSLSILDITIDGITIEPEILSEQIAYKDSSRKYDNRFF